MLNPIEGFRVTAGPIPDAQSREGVQLTIQRGPSTYTEDYNNGTWRGSLRLLRITRLINQGLHLFEEGLSVATTVTGTIGLISLVGMTAGYEYHFPLTPAGIPVLYALSVLSMLGSHTASQQVEEIRQKEQAIQQFLRASRRPVAMQRNHHLP